MNLADLSIRRPIFITCIVILMLAVGYLSMNRLPVDQFPDVTFPVVAVTIQYRGAGPEEIETLIARPVEEEIGTLAGLKTLRSTSQEGFALLIAQFSLETDIKDAEQRIRDRVGSVKRRLPKDIEEPIIRRMDPSDMPVVMVSLVGNLSAARLYDIADDVVKPKLEQVPQVGLVEILGGREREIRVELDRAKLKAFEVSATQVVNRVGASGQNIPAGKIDQGEKQKVIRTLAEFRDLSDIRNTVVNFLGNDRPVTVSDLGRVVDDLKDETSRTLVNGVPAVSLWVFKQSRANTVAVADAVMKRVDQVNKELETRDGKPQLQVVLDGARYIRANVIDVKEAIFIGITLTVVVVFFFLGNVRSTLITGLALPNSLIGAFILMAMAGFTVNIMTLLALSLTVGLLIDDAIVVRENIFRHMEMGSPPVRAAREGTKEVTLAVIATTLTVIAVFGPIAFLQGMVGQFFREFGLTICFAMMISLFDALTVAPMLSAYLGGIKAHDGEIAKNPVARMLRAFDRFQTWLENGYGRVLKFSLRRPIIVILSAIAIFISSVALLAFVPKTFLPPQDFGEFSVAIDLPPGASMDATAKVAGEIDKVLRANKEVTRVVQTVGSRNAEANIATFFVYLVPSDQRTMNTSQFKDIVREQLKPFAHANPLVKDIDAVGAGMRPFSLNITGTDLKEIETVARQVYEKLKNHPALKDPDISYRPGKPEFQAVVDDRRAIQLGVSTAGVGNELRTLVEGTIAAVFREGGKEYDIRVRLAEDQRNIEAMFDKLYVPNLNNSLIRLESVAKPVSTTGPATILRQDRGRYVQISADIAPKGPGMGGAINDVNRIFRDEIKLPPGMGYSFVGQAEDFKDLQNNIQLAVGLGVLFILLVLASLYESFITPFAIMLVLPLAACGAFFALLVTQHSLDIFSMIGLVMLLGVATKNSILLVDYANQRIAKGVERGQAMIEAGKARLRPILMTSFALIAGMLPVAIGLNEASKQRTSMGIAIIGGIISSTFLSLVVVPAAFIYIDRFRAWVTRKFFSRTEDVRRELERGAGNDNGHAAKPAHPHGGAEARS